MVHTGRLEIESQISNRRLENKACSRRRRARSSADIGQSCKGNLPEEVQAMIELGIARSSEGGSDTPSSSNNHNFHFHTPIQHHL